MKLSKVPVIFWYSDPVLPDETAVLAGADFDAEAMVELQLVNGGNKKTWTRVLPAQSSPISLKAIIPARWKKGIYACRVRNDAATSKTVYLNAPEVWWKQGEAGVDGAIVGSWLRLFGKCLDFEGNARVKLFSAKGKGAATELLMEERGMFALKAKIPEDIAPGFYRVEISNGMGGAAGWREAGTLEIKMPIADTRPIFNVLDYGADPTGMSDCTLAIVQALERAQALGGGIVYLPNGRYRIDGILRSGVWMDAPLVIPENVTLRGAGANLTSLWWPTRKKPLTSLIEGASNFGVEDLAIYVQGLYHIVIFGESNVCLKNLIIRANPYFMTSGIGGGPPPHENPTPPPTIAPALSLWGRNNRITNCDVLCSYVVIEIRHGDGNVISGNTLRGSSQHGFHGACQKMIYENNVFEGHILAGGCNIAQGFGSSIARHVYYSGNRSAHLYCGDHEVLTFDGHNGSYFGRIKNVSGQIFKLVGQPQPFAGKGTTRDMYQSAVYIVDGRGAGQFRFLTSYDEKGHGCIDRPWDIDPDNTSLIEIGGFNGQHIIINNSASDAGTLVQLYPTNCQNFVVGNRGIRTSNINSLGYSGCYNEVADFSKITRMEVSWYNQFLDNEIVVGNGWGGGTTHVDRWLGGESTLQIHGNCRSYRRDEKGVRTSHYQTPEWIARALGEKTLRDRSVPSSRYQVVRRHVIHNNSSIRIRGVVNDAVVEHCRIANCARGIRVDMEVDFDMPNDLGMTFDFNPKPDEKHAALPFLRPEGVLLRRNHFENVKAPYSGTALSCSKIEDQV